MKKPEVTGVKVKFEQEGNTLGTTSEYEEIEISLEFQAAVEDEPFYVIKTEGWSFDNIGEIEELIKRAKKILEKK